MQAQRACTCPSTGRAHLACMSAVSGQAPFQHQADVRWSFFHAQDYADDYRIHWIWMKSALRLGPFDACLTILSCSLNEAQGGMHFLQGCARVASTHAGFAQMSLCSDVYVPAVG